jgi:hypothetical protein
LAVNREAGVDSTRSSRPGFEIPDEAVVLENQIGWNVTSVPLRWLVLMVYGHEVALSKLASLS